MIGKTKVEPAPVMSLAPSADGHTWNPAAVFASITTCAESPGAVVRLVLAPEAVVAAGLAVGAALELLLDDPLLQASSSRAAPAAIALNHGPRTPIRGLGFMS